VFESAAGAKELTDSEIQQILAEHEGRDTTFRAPRTRRWCLACRGSDSEQAKAHASSREAALQDTVTAQLLSESVGLAAAAEGWGGGSPLAERGACEGDS